MAPLSPAPRVHRALHVKQRLRELAVYRCQLVHTLFRQIAYFKRELMRRFGVADLLRSRQLIPCTPNLRFRMRLPFE